MSRERKQREFQAGLAEEVDAWLRGDTSKRTFLKRLVEAGGAAALARPGLALLGSGLGASAARAAVELADPSTPFGQAQAAAVKASKEGPPENSAYRAVQAGKQYQGATLNMTYESGLQALEPRNFSGPLWQDLTGIGFNVEELPHPDQYSKPIAEHIAGSGAYDILDIEPAWIPSLADGGVILPIDDYVAKYMDKADLEDYHPLYQFLPTYKGKRWGFFDDGDVLALYYRTDIFGDPKLQQAYQAKYKKNLEVPKTWDEYSQVAQFITDQLAPKVYGAVHFRKAGSPGNQFSFLQQYRANGGKFFDEQSMKAQLELPGRRHHVQADDCGQQGVGTGQQRHGRGRRLGRLAAGQVRDAVLLAADRAHDRELRAAGQGDQLRAGIADRGQGGLRRHAGRQPRAGVRLRQVAGRRFRTTRRPPTCSCNGRPARRSRSPA